MIKFVKSFAGTVGGIAMAAAAASPAIFTSSASAAVVLQGSAGGIFSSVTTGGASTSIAYTIQNTASNVLVFGAYIDNSASSAGFSGLTYNGTAATSLIKFDRVALGYIVLPNKTSGTFNFSATSQNINSIYSIFELSGVDTAVAPTAGTLTNNVSLIATAARFVTDIYGNNNSAAGIVPDASSSGLTSLRVTDANSSAGGGALASGTVLLPSAGTYSLGWNATAPSTSGEAAFGYAAVTPEPASLGLVGISAFLLTRRRRNSI